MFMVFKVLGHYGVIRNKEAENLGEKKCGSNLGR